MSMTQVAITETERGYLRAFLGRALELTSVIESEAKPEALRIQATEEARDAVLSVYHRLEL